MRLSDRPSHNRWSPRHTARHGAVLAGALGLVLAAGGPAAAAQGSTTVEPAGDHFTAELTGVAELTAGSTVITCEVSLSEPTDPLGTDDRNRVPEEPDNSSADGPVTSRINAPSFDSCTTNMAFVDAEITVVDEPWDIAVDHGSPSSAVLTIPQEGVRVQTSGLASCSATVAPDGPTDITGTWTNGAPSTLGFDGATPAVEVTGGFGCPTSADEAVFSATYEITNDSDPTTPITVGE